MKHLKVILYDEDEKSIIEHDSIPEGEMVFSGGNDAIFVDIFLKVDEISIGSTRYHVVSRRFSVEGVKLIVTLKKI